ncbi:MAG TPA: pentapeptide repeat-containing protein [Microlunatus sp.]
MGVFAGKSVFASTGAGDRRYLSASTWRGGAKPVSLPAMTASAAGPTERCVMYAWPDGSTRIQLGNGSWIGLREDLGWLILVETEAAAVPLVLTTDPRGALGATWQARTADGKLATVSYTTDEVDPLLTINGVGTSVFTPSVTTPSLAAIVAAHGCPGADLSGVSLTGGALTGLDLTRADLSRADLTMCRFTDAVLERAAFAGATLTGATFDGADLSHADFTGADLDGLTWGRPKCAPGLVLTGCSARGAKLGSDRVLDCSGASLSTADFTGADLSRWNLTKADLSGATLRGAVLDHVTLDGARLRNVVAPRASFRFATLRGCDAQGADLAHADLSFGDLTRVRMGSRAYLFAIAATYAAQLDKALYVPAELVAEFRQHGVTVSDQDPVSTEMPGKAWSIADPTGPYRLALAPGGQQIDVFAAGSDLVPACLAGTTGQATIGSRASLGGADLRRASWHGSGATLDHADLSGASLVGALLAQLDLSQAYLDGADLSEAVLVLAVLRGCLVHPGSDGRVTAFDRAQLQGADFGGTTLIAANLVDAGVALADGVPLFTLPIADEPHLTPSGVASLRPAFAAAGHPLGASPGLTTDGSWLLDNSACSDPTAPAAYRVTRPAGTLWVYDAQQGSAPLFSLPSKAGGWLQQATAPQQLVLAFEQGGSTLAPKAPITANAWWQITPSDDAPFVGPVAYPRLLVRAEDGCLRVYGSVIVRVRDWLDHEPDGFAFHQTIALDTAIDQHCTGPAGLPRSSVDAHRASWIDFWTAWYPSTVT